MTPQRFHDLVSGRARGIPASLTRGVLWLASWGYCVGVDIRNRLYDRGWLSVASAAVPVVSVGNLTVGGTGKTPCVEYLAQYYRNRDVRVAILSRGYGVESGPNDEALVLEENLPDVPHLQGADRAALATTAVEELESELLILDDGFQHRRLARDLDIVLIDATNPWGHGHLLPRGLLRESRRGLRRADAVIITRSDRAANLDQLRQDIAGCIRPNTAIVNAVHRPSAWQRVNDSTCEPMAFRGRIAAAFCGLGNPESFRQTLVELGLEVRDWRVFPDHHPYARSDVDDLRRWAETLPKHALMLTTQKDAVKLRLPDLAGRELWALRIGLVLRAGAERDELHRRLDEVKKN